MKRTEQKDGPGKTGAVSFSTFGLFRHNPAPIGSAAVQPQRLSVTLKRNLARKGGAPDEKILESGFDRFDIGGRGYRNVTLRQCADLWLWQ